jgi:hypothetical protein
MNSNRDDRAALVLRLSLRNLRARHRRQPALA